MDQKLFYLVFSLIFLTSLPKAWAIHNTTRLPDKKTTDENQYGMSSKTVETTSTTTYFSSWTQQDTVTSDKAVAHDTTELPHITTQEPYPKEDVDPDNKVTFRSSQRDRIRDFNRTIRQIAKNEEDFLASSSPEPTSDIGDSFPRTEDQVIFANVSIKGCGNGMRCSSLCHPIIKQWFESLGSASINESIDLLSTLRSLKRRDISPRTSRVRTKNDDLASLSGDEDGESSWFPEQLTIGEKLSNIFSMTKSESELSYTETLSQRSLVRRRRGSSNSRISFFCKCDDICIEFGDCCVDTLLFCFNLFNKEDDEIHAFFTNRSKEEGAANVTEVPLIQRLAETKDLKKVSADYLITFGTCVRFDVFGGNRVISACPRGFADKNIAAACESKRSSLLPLVSVALERNFYFTFRNVHCAICHGILKSELIAWESSIHCDDSVETLPSQRGGTSIDFEQLLNLVLDGSCQVHFKSSQSIVSHRSCAPGYDVTPELETELEYAVTFQFCSPTDAMLCKAYIHPTEESYRNDHCSKCTLYPVSKAGRKRRSASSKCFNDNGEQNSEKLQAGGVLVLLDVTGRYSQSAKGKSQGAYFCRDNQIFDPLELTCKDFTCGEGEEPYRGICVITGGIYLPVSSQLFPNQQNSAFFTLSHSESTEGAIIGCNELLRFLEDLEGLYPIVQKIENITIQSHIHFTAGNKDRGLGEFNGEKIQCREQYYQSKYKFNSQVLKFFIEYDLDEYEQILQGIGILNVFIIQTYMKGNGTMAFTNIDNVTSTMCPENQALVPLEDFDLSTYKGIEYVAINTSGTQFNFPLMSLGFEASSSFYSGKTEVASSKFIVFVCLQSDIFAWENCSVTIYWQNETTYTMGNTKLKVLNSEREFQRSQVYEIEDKILVCDDLSSINKSFVPGRKEETDEIYRKLNWVCSSISIVFLCIMLLMYWIFPELLTLPGRLIACMAATMMLSFMFNLLTLVDLHHKVFCPIAAAIAHFVTLAHYGWMSAIAVNMSLTFGFATVRCQSAEEGSKHFRRYSAVVWGISAVIVAASLILDLTHNEVETPKIQGFPDATISLLPTQLPNMTEDFFQNKTSMSELFQDSKNDTVLQAKNGSGPVSTHNQNLSSNTSSRYDNFPRYGYPLCTWFSGPLWTRLAFVFVPYGLTFVVDVIGFVLTVRGIFKSARASAKTLDKQIETKSQVIIFLKLSTTMGVSWAISVFFTVSDSRILVYVFTSLVLLQGLLLFLAFMVNKRVIALVRKRYSCLYKVKLSTLNNSSSQISNSTKESEVRTTTQSQHWD